MCIYICISQFLPLGSIHYESCSKIFRHWFQHLQGTVVFLQRFPFHQLPWKTGVLRLTSDTGLNQLVNLDRLPMAQKPHFCPFECLEPSQMVLDVLVHFPSFSKESWILEHGPECPRIKTLPNDGNKTWKNGPAMVASLDDFCRIEQRWSVRSHLPSSTSNHLIYPQSRRYWSPFKHIFRWNVWHGISDIPGDPTIRPLRILAHPASNWGDTNGLTRQSLNLVLIPAMPQNVTSRWGQEAELQSQENLGQIPGQCCLFGSKSVSRPEFSSWSIHQISISGLEYQPSSSVLPRPSLFEESGINSHTGWAYEVHTNPSFRLV